MAWKNGRQIYWGMGIRLQQGAHVRRMMYCTRRDETPPSNNFRLPASLEGIFLFVRGN